MPILSTIRGNDIGPFMQGPRLQGTPDGAAVDEDDEDSRRKCYLCEEMFAADELTEYYGELYCETCLEDAKNERARVEIRRNRDRADDYADMARKDRGLLKED